MSARMPTLHGCAWWARAVQWSDNSSMHGNGKKTSQSVWQLHQPLLSQAFKGDTGLPLTPVLPWVHLDGPGQTGAIKHFEEWGGINSKTRTQSRRLHGDWTLLHSFSGVQIYQLIVRKGTQSIKLCEAQDQGPQRRAHSSRWVQCLLVIWAQC